MTPSLSGPIFVVGMNGSGTTMLLRSLGNHSEIYAHPPETQIIPHYIQSIYKYGDLDRDSQFLRLWMDILSERSLVISNSGRTLPLPSDWKEYGRTVGEVFNYAFSYFATSLHKSIWAEKTPMHVFHISDLADCFPSARFIHVIRDGRDCAASFHRRWKRTPWLTIYRWKKAVLAGHSQGVLLGKDRYMEVKYEHLTENPEQILKAVCDFLAIDFQPQMLRPRQRIWEENRIVQSKIAKNASKWPSYFRKETVTDLNRTAGDVLQRFGYPVGHGSGDVDPSSFRVITISAYDYMRQGFHEVFDVLTGRQPSWVLFQYGKKIKSAIRQILALNR